MDDEVGIAADRGGEVAVGGARESGMTEVARVVARLLERAEHERREGLPPAARPRDVARRSCLTRRPRARRHRAARAVSGTGGVGTSSAASFCDQQRDRARLGRLMHAVERRPPATARNAATCSLARIISSSTSMCAPARPHAVRRATAPFSNGTRAPASSPRARRARTAPRAQRRASSAASVELLDDLGAASRRSAWP